MKKKSLDDEFVKHLSRYIGKTVTIYTTSGGQSGLGFTGMLLSVNNCFIRLSTRVDPAPDCSLDNGCAGYLERSYGSNHSCYAYHRNYRNNGYYENFESNESGVGTVADIPINRIVSFVHNNV